MTCTSFNWTLHVLEQMAKRAIGRDAVVDSIENGDLIEDYPNDFPYPSRRVLHWHGGRPLHVVVAANPDGSCTVVTAYEPDNIKWLEDFRHRRPK